MTAVLVTGMSGTGKSTLLAALAHRGHQTVDTDQGDWNEEVVGPDGIELLWREEPMARLLTEPRSGWLFVAGCVANQGAFYDRFAAVVLLSTPRTLMLSRLATRTTNPFGQQAADRTRIVADLEAVEPLLRRTATVEVSTDGPLDEVVAAVEAAAQRAVRP